MIFGPGWSQAQNLVPNPDLENYTVCPDSISQFYRCADWFQPTNGTTDYFNDCAIWPVGVPGNQSGVQIALSGVGYGGIIVYVIPTQSFQYREYIEARLISPMVQGQKYFVSFWVSLAEDSRYYTDDIGVAFTVDSLLENSTHQIPFTPQIENPAGQLLSDKTNWTKISGEFIATGAEQFITIGNFKNDANTSVYPISGTNYFCYYYIEDICVSTDSLTCNAITGINPIGNDQNFAVFPNPFEDLLSVTSNYNEPLELIFYDNLGRMVFSKSITGDISINTKEFDTGIYYFQLRNKESVLRSGKMVKQ